MLSALLLQDLLFRQVINSAGRPLPPTNLHELCPLCPRGDLRILNWVRSFLILIVVAGHDMKKFVKSFDDTGRLRVRIIKAVLWVIVNFVLFNWAMSYFPTFGWWFAQSTTLFFVPHQGAKLYESISDVKRRKETRKFGILVLVTFFGSFFFGHLTDALQGTNFSPLTYLVHAIFSVLLFLYGRLIYVNTIRLLDPKQYAASPNLKKWINWSSPVSLWFIIALVGVPMSSSVNSCLGPFLWG